MHEPDRHAALGTARRRYFRGLCESYGKILLRIETHAKVFPESGAGHYQSMRAPNI